MSDDIYGGRGRTTPLACAHCGLTCGPSDDDPCIEALPGVMNACCGHGDPTAAYVQFSPTHRIAGVEAAKYLRRLTSGSGSDRGVSHAPSAHLRPGGSL